MGLLKKRKEFINSPEAEERKRVNLESKILPSELVNEQKNPSRMLKSETINDRVLF